MTTALPARREPARRELDLSLVVTQLMKGALYQDLHPKAWRHLLPLQPQVSWLRSSASRRSSSRWGRWPSSGGWP